MTHTAGHAPAGEQVRRVVTALTGRRPGERRHPLVALAMVLPAAVLLAVLFGGVDAVVAQASSVAGLLGR
jgi:hypothetical protein